MDENEVEDLLKSIAGEDLVMLPGEEIARGGGFLRGHGTYVEADIEQEESDDDEGEVLDDDAMEGGRNNRLVASVAGVVMRVNKLISVRPVQSRYSGDIGDVVIGRIALVGNKQWRVDLGARQLGVLMLGSINLPGGALRRRTLEDQLQMRTLFQENDLVSAEVSSFYQHGGMAIHTRSMRYGRLENGVLVSVPPSLIKRLSQHFCSLPCGVDAIFGLNGRIWLTCSRGEQDAVWAEQARMTEQMEEDNKQHAAKEIGTKVREAISRVRNSITVLSCAGRLISPASVMDVYDRSVKQNLVPKAMLAPQTEALLLV
mmetsp:Transcript_2453/g.4065  ORF Transcript_2453/g.4065 Transcript_2453/m.4065 type:complete len:315 (+) Transcript_2453:238-1182(+)